MRYDVQHRVRQITTTAAVMASLSVAACGHKSDRQSAAGDVATPSATSSATTPAVGDSTTSTSPARPADTIALKHHSKLGGALVGAAVGHVLGGHAVAGAAAGALVQHERNKHERKP